AAPVPCLSDVRGQAGARRALEVAAAGGHSLLMLGPPGAGKSMLAARLPGLLPPLERNQALEAAAVATMAGMPDTLTGQPPFRAPHHSASVAALVGGGGRPRPGEISLAHHGVLFLDELPEFSRRSLEALREPLEAGRVVISRALHAAQFPARFQLVAAMNPCPCGWRGHPARTCACTPDQVTRYAGKISGPLLDRIDLHVALPPSDPAWMTAPPGESSQAVRERVVRCRERQMARQGKINAGLAGAELDEFCVMDADAQMLLQQAMRRLTGSARAMHRALRVARTIADLDGQAVLAASHVAQAVQYRRTGV
ncbi:MAG: YifB family Mg chelatase-like AAA ATPase, partial [Achromobacter mucicolens]